jgi:hypothetical protein
MRPILFTLVFIFTFNSVLTVHRYQELANDLRTVLDDTNAIIPSVKLMSTTLSNAIQHYQQTGIISGTFSGMLNQFADSTKLNAIKQKLENASGKLQNIGEDRLRKEISNLVVQVETTLNGLTIPIAFIFENANPNDETLEQMQRFLNYIELERNAYIENRVDRQIYNNICGIIEALEDSMKNNK